MSAPQLIDKRLASSTDLREVVVLTQRGTVMQRQSYLYISLASLLTLLSGLLLFLASRSEQMAPITNLLIVVSGMVIFSAFSAFQRFLESREDAPAIHISFNETVLRDIMPICNRAMHGESLTNEDAVKVVRVGNQLLGVLRSIELSVSEQSQWETAT